MQTLKARRERHLEILLAYQKAKSSTQLLEILCRIRTEPDLYFNKSMFRVLYTMLKNDIQIIDIMEDIPIAFRLIEADIHKCPHINFQIEIHALADKFGNKLYKFIEKGI